jgi:aromatic ring-opening dioxygenase catalytic subunit (LigB family)
MIEGRIAGDERHKGIRLPALFFGHGDPMNALASNSFDGGSISMLAVQLGQ